MLAKSTTLLILSVLALSCYCQQPTTLYSALLRTIPKTTPTTPTTSTSRFVITDPPQCLVNEDCSQPSGLPCDRVYCDTASEGFGSGVCTVVTRDCATERCITDNLMNSDACYEACSRSEVLCPEFSQFVTSIFDNVINGSTTEISQATIAFPGCPFANVARKRDIIADELCYRCVIEGINKEIFGIQTSQAACHDTGSSCETIQSECLTGNTTDADFLCSSMCTIMEQYCVAYCDEEYFNNVTLVNTCTYECSTMGVSCRTQYCSEEEVCGICDAIVESVQTIYVNAGSFAAGMFAQQFVYELGNDTTSPVNQYFNCIFESFLTENDTETDFGTCLSQTACSLDACNANTGSCTHSPSDVCAAQADANKCLQGLHCEATPIVVPVLNITTTGSIDPATNVHVYVFASYAYGSISCAPCIVEIPLPGDVLYDIYIMGTATIVPDISPSIINGIHFDNFNINVPYAEYSIYYNGVQISPDFINFGSISISGGGCVANTEDTMAVNVSISGAFSTIINPLCDDTDVYTGNDCDVELSCVTETLPVQCAAQSSNQTCECAPSTGRCVCQYITCYECGCQECDDHNRCTNDICNHTIGCCKHVPIDCNEESHNKCLLRACDRYAGCQTIWENTCDDSNECTLDSCDSNTGVCHHTSIAYVNGSNQDIDATLAQYGKCARLVCNRFTGEWSTELVRIDDGHMCTTDSCDPQTGVVSSTQVICPNPMDNACLIPVCDENAGGCTFTLFDCDDHNPCTDDICNTNTEECIHPQKSCGCTENGRNPSNLCQRCGCDANGGGCFLEDVVCVNNNPCVISLCAADTGSCYTEQKYCNCSANGYLLVNSTENMCLACGCSSEVGGCWTREVNCDDHDPTTEDTCMSALGCRHMSIACTQPPQGPCYEYPFDTHTGICGTVAVPINCDDNNFCTNDTCVSGVCMHTQKCIDPTSTDMCVTRGCDAATGTCLAPATKDCNDHNPCTIDSCNPTTGLCNQGERVVCEVLPDLCMVNTCLADRGGCVPIPVVCNDHDLCTIDSCNSSTGSCSYIPKNCDDGNVCTVDSCFMGECRHREKTCPSTPGSCIVQTCSMDTGECTAFGTIGTCDDGDSCTSDQCNLDTGVCTHVLEHCGTERVVINASDIEFNGTQMPGWSFCELHKCDGRDGQCYAIPVDCSDDDPCTIDSCEYGVGCIHDPKDCEDELVSLRGHAKDLHDLSMFSKGANGRRQRNLCMLAKCGVGTGRCYHEPVVCTSPDPRATCDCDPDTGKCVCVETECEDNDPCMVNRTSRVDGRCHAKPRDCRDDNPCTVDGCLAGEGECTHVPRNCNDSNACTWDTCARSSGLCLHEPIECTGCDLCMVYSCDPSIGCVSTPVSGECGACEVCYCDPATGDWIRNPKPTTDNNPCTIDTCVEGIIFHIPVDCTDDLACTIDTCDNTTGQCVHTVRDAPDELDDLLTNRCEYFTCEECRVHHHHHHHHEADPTKRTDNGQGRNHHHNHDQNDSTESVDDDDETYFMKCIPARTTYDDEDISEDIEEEELSEEVDSQVTPPQNPDKRSKILPPTEKKEDHHHHHHHEHSHRHRMGYKFSLTNLVEANDTCAIITCNPTTGLPIRTPLQDGTLCNLDDTCHISLCLGGTCVAKGDKPCLQGGAPAPTGGSVAAGVIVAIIVASIVAVLLLILAAGLIYGGRVTIGPTN